MSIPHRLVELIAERQIIPFIGAGFSAPSLLPSWQQLIRRAVENLAPEKMTLLREAEKETTLMDVADLLDSLLSTRLPLQDHFIRQFEDPRIETNQYHDALLNFDFDTIVTTNWDRLIERRLEQSRIATNVIYRDIDVPGYDPSRRTRVLKIHGTVSDSRSLVFRKSQYEVYWDQRPLMYSLLSVLSLTRGFLFLGYGFGDPNFLELLKKLSTTAGDARREHYAITYSNPELEGRLRDLGVVVVQAMGFDASKRNYATSTMATLQEIREASGVEASDNLSRARLVNAEIVRVTSRRPPKGVLRMRGALGWLSNPEPEPDDPVYGSHERDVEERRMSTLVEKFLDKVPGARVQCILHLRAKPLLREYAPRHIRKRMNELIRVITARPEQVEIVHEDLPSQLNLMLFDTQASLQGFCLRDQPGIQRARLVRDSRAVARDLELFENDYLSALEYNRVLAERMGIDVADGAWIGQFVIQMLNQEIASLTEDDGESITALAAAVVHSVRAHTEQGQLREDGTTPFAVHPVRVMERLRGVGIEERSVLAAAALHDVVEDCHVPLEDIESRYGSDIREFVETVTKLVGESDSDYARRLRAGSPSAQIIKLADRLDNVWEMRHLQLERFGGLTRDEYLTNSVEVLGACRSANKALAAALDTEIALARERAPRAKP